MRIYLSGPISNNPNYLIDFANAQRELEAKGHEVINPARLSQFFPESITKDCEPGSENYKRILSVEAEIIRVMADRVAMLKGWTHSRGARFEKEVAENEGIPILYAEDAENDEVLIYHDFRVMGPVGASVLHVDLYCGNCERRIDAVEEKGCIKAGKIKWTRICPLCGATFARAAYIDENARFFNKIRGKGRET